MIALLCCFGLLTAEPVCCFLFLYSVWIVLWVRSQNAGNGNAGGDGDGFKTITCSQERCSWIAIKRMPLLHMSTCWEWMDLFQPLTKFPQGVCLRNLFGWNIWKNLDGCLTFLIRLAMCLGGVGSCHSKIFPCFKAYHINIYVVVCIWQQVYDSWVSFHRLKTSLLPVN